MRSMLLACAALVHMVAAAPAHAQAPYPTKAIRFVVPFPPGGPLDVVARMLGAEMNRSFGQPVLVENRPGAGGNIGADHVARAAADGHTILMGAVSTHAINPWLYSKMPYDPVADFAPVTLVTSVPNVLVVHPSVPARDVKELIALAKARPGQLNYASGSIGSAGHLAGELFKTTSGVDLVHIPYKGAAAAVADLLAGQVSLMFDNLASALPHIRAERVRPFAVTTARRTPFLPGMPTLAEAGLRGFDLGTWFGVFAPAGTPREIVARLNGELARILVEPAVKERLATLGAEPMPMAPDAFAAFVKSELAKYRPIVQVSGAKVD